MTVKKLIWIGFIMLPILFLSLYSVAMKENGDSLGTFSKQEPIRGGIVPHHTLAGKLIHDFFQKVSDQNPHTIILLAPNHFERGESRVQTATLQWNTEYGVVTPHSKHISHLSETGIVQVNNSTLQQEHAIVDLMPFIKESIPDATVVPLMLSGTMSIHEIDELASTLAELTNDQTLVVAAVDFSHYLKREDARKNDAETLDVLKSRDYKTLLSLDNAYTDSPASLATLLKVMEKKNWTNMVIIENTNSSILLNDPFAETTSYFEIMYY